MGNDTTTTQDTTPDFTDADLSQMAASLDAQGGMEAPASAETAEVRQLPDAASGPDPSSAAGGNEAASDVSAGVDASKTTEVKSDGTEPVEEANGGPRTKYARERERRDRSWKALQQEKEAFHRERDAFRTSGRAGAASKLRDRRYEAARAGPWSLARRRGRLR